MKMAKMEDGQLRREPGANDLESARLIQHAINNDETNVFVAHGVSQTDKPSLLEACKKGDVETVTNALKTGADVTVTDQAGMNCLLVAIKNGRRDVIMELINHDRWKDMFSYEARGRRNDRLTPMRELIKQYPDIAKKVLDKCMTRTGEPHSEKYQITYYYELIEDTYSDWKSPAHTSFNQPVSRDPYSSEASDLIRNHPLTLMVDLERNNLLEHPLVRQLIRQKWISYRAMFHGIVFIYFLFSVSLSVYMSYAKPPYFSKPANDKFDEERDFCSFAFIPEEPYRDFGFWKHSLAFALGLLIIILAVVSLVKEAFQFHIRGAKYFPSLPNCFELFVSGAAIVFVVMYKPCSPNVYRMNILWQIGAFAVFFAWITLLMIIRKMPHFGVYVLMFTNVARSFLRVLVLFVLFLITFALTFHALLQNQDHFSTMSSSIARTMVMMVGEFDYTGVFKSYNETYEETVFYYKTTDVFFCTFVVVMAILLENLLIGLAVGDIQSIREMAIITRIALQIQQVLEVEFSLPKIFRKSSMIHEETVYPNMPQTKRCKLFRWCAYTPFGKLFYYIFNMDEAAAEKDLDLANDDEEEEEADIAKVKKMLEARDKTIQQLQTLLESMNAKFDKLSSDFSDLRQEVAKK